MLIWINSEVCRFAPVRPKHSVRGEDRVMSTRQDSKAPETSTEPALPVTECSPERNWAEEAILDGMWQPSPIAIVK
jgi:hypothetical protein